MNTNKPLIVRVLVVEDSEDDLEIVKRLLEKSDEAKFVLGYAFNLKEALDLSWHEDWDVVLLDLGLPDSMGLDTLHRMVTARPLTPVVVLTGYEDLSSASRALRMGARDYIPKSLMPTELLPRALHYALVRQELDNTVAQHMHVLRRVVEGIMEKHIGQSEDQIVLPQVLGDLEDFALFMVDQEGRILQTNRSTQRILGENVAKRGLAGIMSESELKKFLGSVEGDGGAQWRGDDGRLRLLSSSWKSGGGTKKFLVLATVVREDARSPFGAIEAIQRARRDVLNQVSHHLRTPLTPVLLQLAVLQRSLQGRARERVDVVERNVRRLKRTINEMLDVGDIEAGTFVLRRVASNVAALVRAVAGRLEGVEPAVGGPQELEAHVDPVRLAEAVESVLKALTSVGDVHLQVSGHESLISIVIGVHDCRVTRAEIASWFDPFTDGAGGGSDVLGTGLSLFRAKLLVEAHEGTLEVGEDAEGAPEVQVTVPVSEPRAAAATPMARGRRPPAGRRPAKQSDPVGESDPITGAAPSLASDKTR